MTQTYGYIVIGAGTSGCVVANRLSLDPAIRVALLEFGGMDTNPDIYDRDIDAMYRLWRPEAEENWGATARFRKRGWAGARSTSRAARSWAGRAP